MPVIRTQNGTSCLIKLEGEIGLADALALQQALEAALCGGTEVQLDMQDVTAVDVTTLQLLVAAGRPEIGHGPRILLRASDAVRATCRESGFSQLPEIGFEQQSERSGACRS